MTTEDILHQSIQALHACPQDAQQCGQPAVEVLTSILKSLCSTTRLANTASRCLMLKEQANEAIATYPYSEVPDCWRRLYMDATLLHVISRLLDSDPSLNENELLEMIRLLDMANIVTAYFEQDRREALFDLLKLVQDKLKSLDGSYTEERPAKKQRRHGKTPAARSSASTTESPKSTLLPGIQNITVYSLEDAPDMSELASHTEPFIVKAAVSDWPAISDPSHAWADSEYLLRIAGRGRIVPVEIGSSYTAEGWTQKMMSFEEFLAKINWTIHSTRKEGEESGDEEPVLYLAQHDLFQQFPELLADVITPDYVWSDPGPPDYYSEYRSPNTLAGYTINAWMGPKNTYSPAHTDPFYNCYAQVVGRKHIWVASPSCTAAMESKVVDQDGDEDDLEGDEDQRNAAAQQFMHNTAQIHVFEASSKVEEDDAPAYLRQFREEVLPFARQAILEEGDLLFMPPKWWHSLKSLERSFSVSMWF